MAVYAIKATLQALETYLARSGYVRHAQVGEPKSVPNVPMAAAVFMNAWSVVQVTLSTTIELHTVTIRLYVNMLRDPIEQVEFDLARAVSEITADLAGEFDLGGTVRNVDVGGQHGPPLLARWGYIELGGTMFRIADIIVGLIVDDSATLAP